MNNIMNTSGLPITTTNAFSSSSPLPKIDFAVGGQAVIEGVMMRSPNFVTVAVRKSKGNIKIKDENFQSIAMRLRLFGLPLIRGVVNLFEMMIIGMRMLNFSASEALEEDTVTQENDSETQNKEGQDKIQQQSSDLTTWQKIGSILSFSFSIAFALGLSLFLFKFLPLWITDFLSKNFSILNEHYILFNLIDGGLKTIFFVSYIALLGLMPNLRRVFQYHGAEHKSIYTYERGLDLNVENAKAQTRFHPRCGTSFILVVFLISILVYTFVPRQEDFLLNFGLRVLFLPLIAGISYEFLKWSARKQKNWFVRMLISPGLWFQRLTTKEPDEQQLEVALSALKQALVLEQARINNAKDTQSGERLSLNVS